MSKKLLGIYPVDTETQIKTACAYFAENHAYFNHSDRVDYARGLSEAIKTAGLELPETVGRYSGPPRHNFDAGYSIRYKYTHEEHHPKLAELHKQASFITPDEAAFALNNFDHEAGIANLGGRIPTAHETLFYNEKTAAQDMPDDVWSGTTDRLRRSALESWVNSSEYYDLMKKHFPIDMVQSMRGNPWPIFSSLPDPHKRIIARMCNDRSLGQHPQGQSMYDHDGAVDKSELHRPASQMQREIEEIHNTKARLVRAIGRL